MKSRVVNRMVENQGEDFDESEGESTASDLWEDSGVYSEDEELERELIWVDEGELSRPLQEQEGVRQPAATTEPPLRRSGRLKK